MMNEITWAPWTPLELSFQLAGFDYPWAVVGGWALDLWQNAQSRPHEDIEITILRPDFDALRAHLPQCDIFCVKSGEIWPLPENEPAPNDVAQFWCLDRKTNEFRLDIMIERGTPRTWVFKRNKWIKRPRAAAQGVGYKGLTYLNPACVLLFKAKAMRSKDLKDFDAMAPKLTEVDRVWLKEALEVTYSNHPWIKKL
ncbi:MAG: amino acid transporter [Litoreibacter sp.]